MKSEKKKPQTKTTKKNVFIYRGRGIQTILKQVSIEKIILTTRIYDIENHTEKSNYTEKTQKPH